MHTFELHIASENGELFCGPVSALNINTRSGYITVLPKHVPLVSIVVPGQITVRNEHGEQFFPSTHGILDIRPDKVIVLLHRSAHEEVE